MPRPGSPRSGQGWSRSARPRTRRCSTTSSPRRRTRASGSESCGSNVGEITMVAALNRALADALEADHRTLVFGEDIGPLGGVFRVTEGLQERFGRDRVFDTPIAEAGIAGICVGLALAGWRPIAEFQFDGFSYPAPDPVIVLEPKARYWSKEVGELAPDMSSVGRARVLREGSACALISYGAMVARCLEAADRLGAEGTSCAVLDLRWLSPLDLDAIREVGVATGHVVVVHEAPRTLGMGAEIVARVVELAFDHLEAPVVRVTAPDVPYPPASLEQRYLPSVDRIVEAARATVRY